MPKQVTKLGGSDDDCDTDSDNDMKEDNHNTLKIVGMNLGEAADQQQETNVALDDDDDDDDETFSLLNPNTSLDENEVDAISLLKQIFPEETPQSLRQLHQMHQQRLLRASSHTNNENDKGNHTHIHEISVAYKSSNVLDSPIANTSPVSSSSFTKAASNNTYCNLDDEWLFFVKKCHSQMAENLENKSKSSMVFHDHHKPPRTAFRKHGESRELRNKIATDNINTPPWSRKNVILGQTTGLVDSAEYQTTKTFQLYTKVIPYRHSQIGLGLTLKFESTSIPTPTNVHYHNEKSVDKKKVLVVHALIEHSENPCNSKASNTYTYTTATSTTLISTCNINLQAGDIVVGINGDFFHQQSQRKSPSFVSSASKDDSENDCDEDISDNDKSEINCIVQQLKNAPTPLVLHFVRYLLPAVIPVERKFSLLDEDHGDLHPPISPLSLSFSQPSIPVPVISIINEHNNHATRRKVTPTSSYRTMTWSWSPEILNRQFDNIRIPSVNFPVHLLIKIMVDRGLLILSSDASTSSAINNATSVTKNLDLLHQFHLRAYDLETMKMKEEEEEDDQHQDTKKVLPTLHTDLCLRIVNIFFSDREEGAAQQQHDNKIVYTIWIHNVGTGYEWYTYKTQDELDDFCNTWCQNLGTTTGSEKLERNSIITWLSPKRLRFSESQFSAIGKRKIKSGAYYESLLRNLCHSFYLSTEMTAELVEQLWNLHSFLGTHTSSTETEDKDTGNDSQEKHVIKLAIKRYAYRILRLPLLQEQFDKFLDSANSNEDEGKDSSEPLKLDAISKMLDSCTKLIWEGCHGDIKSIIIGHLNRIEQNASPLGENPMIYDDEMDQSYWDSLSYQAIREQVELELYVPLRSCISKWLVKTCEAHDQSLHLKIQYMRSSWGESISHIRQDLDGVTKRRKQEIRAAAILKDGVGCSSLPCIKLRAIVDAAEVLMEKDGEKGIDSGADTFLPRFIRCVVRADLERPFALCVLLQKFCDQKFRTGQIGYFLASLEAAIAYLVDSDEMISEIIDEGDQLEEEFDIFDSKDQEKLLFD